ncbi:cytochrome P450 [Aspergillus multicolor]|uniref:cytochrome P450 n=1 Tax=Aspergillus multicolor TaxID=41759 RepID=UPI003CCCE50C
MKANIALQLAWRIVKVGFGSFGRRKSAADFQKLLERYGPVFRVAPNEQFLKDSLWWARQPGHPDSLLSKISPEKHAHMRRTLSPGFTARALRQQEPFIQKYVNLLVAQLQDVVKEAKGVEVSMTPWFNYTTSDIFGDLGFVESVKAAGFVVSTRYYPLVESILLKCIPLSMRKIQRDHYQQIVDKVQRPNLMSHLIEEGGALRLHAGEVFATFMIFTTAGSETTATALTGVLNYLVNHSPDSLRQFEDEIRGTFSTTEDITLEAVRNLPFLNAVIKASDLSDPNSCFFNDRRQAVQPFTIGPRARLGQQLAWAEMRLILAKLVWTFDFEAIKGQCVRWEHLRTYLLVKRKPINVRIALRR